MLRRFRFSLKLLLVVLIAACLLLGWLSSRIPHCRAVEQLQKIGANIHWMREQPTWLDKQLGPWRLDRLKWVHYTGGGATDFSMIADLNYLEDFSTYECLDIDYQPLLQHTETIRYLGLDPFPDNPEDFFSQFHNLETLLVQRDLDLSRLTHLKKLKSIHYYYRSSSQFEYLTGFKQLEYADLSCTKIESVKPLVELKKLEELILDGCEQLEDIAGVDQLPRLKHLSLDGCYNIKDLGPIANCTNLEILALPPHGKISMLAELKNLTAIYTPLSHLDPSDLKVLGRFPKLRRLDLDWSRMNQFNGIDLDLALLKEKKDLEYLCACRIADSDDLENFPRLQKLIIRDSVIKNADSILSLKKLDMLILSNCEFSDETLSRLQTRIFSDGFKYSRRK